MAGEDEWWVVDNTLALILRVSRFYGVAPVRFNSRSRRVAYLSRIHYYVGILVAFILDMLFIWQFYFKIKKSGTLQINNNNLLDAISYIASLIFINFFVFYNFTRMKKFLCLVIRITDIKKTINSDFCQHTKQWRSTCLTLLLTLGLWILMVGVYLIPEWKLLQTFYLFYTSNLWLFIELQFVILARYITSTFGDLNERLEDVLLQLNVQHNNIHRTALARKVRYLSRSFVSICKVMLELNSIESVNLFYHLCNLSFNFGFILNSFLKSLAHIDCSNDKLSQTVDQCMFLFFNLFRTLLLVESCHGTRKQISRTRLLTGKIINHVTSSTDQLLEAADTLFKQVLLNDIAYIAMGICVIERHVISTIFGVMTTLVSISTN